MIIERAELRKTIADPDADRIVVEAELDHLKGNDRPYFSVTATLYKGRRDIAGGMLHDDVLEHFPELEPLVALHLADANGVPMHAKENARFWMGLSRNVDGSPMSPKDQYRHRLIVTDDDGIEWAPEALARHLRCSTSAAHAWREVVAGFSVEQQDVALDDMIEAMSGRWKDEADEGRRLLRRLPGTVRK